MEAHLWSFGHSMFHQSKLSLLIKQWGNSSPVTDICINQNFSLFLSVQMDEYDESKFHDLVTNWEVAIGHLEVSFKLFHELTAVPFSITPTEDQLNKQSKLCFSPVKLDKELDHREIVEAIHFSVDLEMEVDAPYYNVPLTLEVVLDLKLPQDLPFSRKLVTDYNERRIRMLIDNNRHSVPKCQARSLATSISFINPLQISHTCHELDCYSSILSITMSNQHNSVALVIDDLFHHINQTRIDVEKILDHFPQYLGEESFEAISLTENDAASTAVASSSSSTGSSSPSVGHMFEFFPLTPERRFELRAGDSKCIVYRIEVRQEVVQLLQQWSGFVPFGRFTSPLTVNWRVNHMVDHKHSNDSPPLLCQRVQTFQMDMFWSISSNNVVTRNASLLSDLLRHGYSTNLSSYLSSFHPKSISDQALLKIDIEKPSCVKVKEEFTLKIFIHNNSRLNYTDLLILTSSLHKSSLSQSVG